MDFDHDGRRSCSLDARRRTALNARKKALRFSGALPQQEGAEGGLSVSALIELKTVAVEIVRPNWR